MKKLSTLTAVALGAAALAAPGAHAYVASGDGGPSAARAMSSDTGGTGTQVAPGDNGSLGIQQADAGSGGSVQVRASGEDFAWFSLVVALTALAALGATGAALTHRRTNRQHATLTL